MIYTIDNPFKMKYLDSDFPFENFRGCAITESGSIGYYVNGVLHKEDGPAVIFSTGSIRYYFQGKHIDVSSNEEFDRHIKLSIFE